MPEYKATSNDSAQRAKCNGWLERCSARPEKGEAIIDKLFDLGLGAFAHNFLVEIIDRDMCIHQTWRSKRVHNLSVTESTAIKRLYSTYLPSQTPPKKTISVNQILALQDKIPPYPPNTDTSQEAQECRNNSNTATQLRKAIMIDMYLDMANRNPGLFKSLVQTFVLGNGNTALKDLELMEQLANTHQALTGQRDAHYSIKTITENNQCKGYHFTHAVLWNTCLPNQQPQTPPILLVTEGRYNVDGQLASSNGWYKQLSKHNLDWKAQLRSGQLKFTYRKQQHPEQSDAQCLLHTLPANSRFRQLLDSNNDNETTISVDTPPKPRAGAGGAGAGATESKPQQARTHRNTHQTATKRGVQATVSDAKLKNTPIDKLEAQLVKTKTRIAQLKQEIITYTQQIKSAADCVLQLKTSLKQKPNDAELLQKLDNAKAAHQTSMTNPELKVRLDEKETLIKNQQLLQNALITKYETIISQANINDLPIDDQNFLQHIDTTITEAKNQANSLKARKAQQEFTDPENCIQSISTITQEAHTAKTILHAELIRATKEYNSPKEGKRSQQKYDQRRLLARRHFRIRMCKIMGRDPLPARHINRYRRKKLERFGQKQRGHWLMRGLESAGLCILNIIQSLSTLGGGFVHGVYRLSQGKSFSGSGYHMIGGPTATQDKLNDLVKLSKVDVDTYTRRKSKIEAAAQHRPTIRY